MNTDIYSSTGIALAALLALSWPVAYALNHGHAGQAQQMASNRPVVSNNCSCVSPSQPVNAFRMGINPDYPPFAGKIVL